MRIAVALWMLFAVVEGIVSPHNNYMLFYPSLEDCRNHRDTAHTIISDSGIGSVANSNCDDFISACVSSNGENYCSVDKGCLPAAVPSIVNEFVVFQTFSGDNCTGTAHVYTQFRLGACVPPAQHQAITNDTIQSAKFTCGEFDSEVTVTFFSNTDSSTETSTQTLPKCDGTNQNYCPVIVKDPVPKKKSTNTLTIVAGITGAIVFVIVALLVFVYFR